MAALFRWSDGDEHYGAGECKDVGYGGLFIITAHPPKFGARITVELVLRPLRNNLRPPRIEVSGHVVRLEKDTDHSGFAVAGHMELVSENLERFSESFEGEIPDWVQTSVLKWN